MYTRSAFTNTIGITLFVALSVCHAFSRISSSLCSALPFSPLTYTPTDTYTDTRTPNHAGMMGIFDITSAVIAGYLWETYSSKYTFLFSSATGLTACAFLLLWRQNTGPIISDIAEVIGFAPSGVTVVDVEAAAAIQSNILKGMVDAVDSNSIPVTDSLGRSGLSQKQVDESTRLLSATSSTAPYSSSLSLGVPDSESFDAAHPGQRRWREQRQRRKRSGWTWTNRWALPDIPEGD